MAERKKKAPLKRPALGYPQYAAADWPDFLVRLAGETGAKRVFIAGDKNAAGTARRAARAFGEKSEAKLRLVALGERRKTLSSVSETLEWLARQGAGRDSLLIGVGGGVAGDTFGLAAALYMRGIPFVPVATTLVAMADAALGGKTGVNLRAGKNLAGVFRDPIAVVHDVTALRSLPRAQIREGLAEVLKAAIIAGGEPFERLRASAGTPFAQWDWAAVVGAACDLKAEIVAADPREHGRREVLNLGHTFAHAFERVSGYRISHGQAVALGLRSAGLLALETGRFSRAEHAQVVETLRALKLPVALKGLRARDVLSAMQTDKKVREGSLRFVLPRAIGDVEFGILAPPEAVKKAVKMIAKAPAPDELI